MIVSFTQTYGNQRKKLLEIYSKDKRLIEFKNHCDINIYSFHNCSSELIDYFKENNSVKNTKILIFNNISYGQCIKIIKKKLKEVGCTYFFFSQDDTFSFPENENIDFDEYFHVIKKYPKEFMHCLGYGLEAPGGLRAIINETTPIIEESDTFKLYGLDTFQIFKASRLPTGASLMPMSDEPYICSEDYVDIIYDDDYCNSKNIWSAEAVHNKKFSNSKIILNRFISNYAFFKNYNIIGGEYGPGNLGMTVDSKYVSKECLINELRKRNLY